MENVKGSAWGSKRAKTQRGFSIIEFLLVLTAFVIFLGAAFIGYRTLKANGNETQIANRFKLFATGLKKYAQDFYNSYPYVECASANDWMNGVASSNNIASCQALEQYIGSFVQNGPWTYTGCVGTTNGTHQCAQANTGTGGGTTYSVTQGYYTFTTAPIDNAYVQSILNQANAYGLTCSVVPSAYTGSSLITCTSQPVLVSGSNTVNYF
jgi:prepilin-type N-terminal cleavage/methylation domain-containing protein